MSDGVGFGVFTTIVQYVVDTWKRSELSGFSQGVSLPDPGHGHDEISPIAVVGVPFDPDRADDVAPFAPSDLVDREVSGSAIDGTGFIALEVVPSGPVRVMSPGNPPELAAPCTLRVLIATPTGRGPALAMSYLGALAMILRYKHWAPGTHRIDSIQSVSPPPEFLRYDTDDSTFRYDQADFELTCFYRGIVAATA